MAADTGLVAAEGSDDDVGGLLAGSHHRPTGGNQRQQPREVRRLDDLQELVRSIVLQPTDLRSGVEHRNALFLAEIHDPLPVEPPLTRYNEMLLLPEEYQTDYAPEIIDEIGVEELHRPALPRRRKTP